MTELMAYPATTAPPGLQAGSGPSVAATDDLAERAIRVRERIIEMCAGSTGGHLGGSMSLVEILLVLYFDVLRMDPDAPADPARDLLLLSKGHGVLCLYAVLAERGFLPAASLADYGRPGGPFMAHPNPALPGVEMPSGALGHGLPIGVGAALDARLSGSDRRVVVVLGDGELQEGSVWEAAMAASSLKLSGLTAVVDRNRLQITGTTESVIGLEPLEERWRAFGWTVRAVDGHDPGELREALTVPPELDRPTVVLARTTKGRGLPYVEDRLVSHFAKLGERERRRALAAVRTGSRP
ncbi:transketolase [Jatrophihabitans sp.]|uniref:transketolase n=1 Tax=Jatrophihabitans sp. TaxID=1932789 RepID=UPI002B8EADF8|nr:transketolase [Jatrophihabitans sp.]